VNGYTFGRAAETCFAVDTAGGYGAYVQAATSCADGAALVLFDNNGGYNTDENIPSEPTGSWQALDGPFNYTPEGATSPTASWEVDQYQTQDSITVYALVCWPFPLGTINDRSYPLEVFNHGGFGEQLQGCTGIGCPYYGITGNLTGNATQQGFDNTADELGLCMNAAQNGWIGVVSSYRGEGVYVLGPNNSALVNQVQAVGNGDFEYCLGEVTDVLALLDHFLGLTGCALQIDGRCVVPYDVVTPNQVLMVGYSHGGCVTERAVQQGAPVNAAVTFAAITDDAEVYQYCDHLVGCIPAGWSAMHGLTHPTPDDSPFVADSYAWRSPVWFESLPVGFATLNPAFAKGQTAQSPIGLRSRPDVPFLMLQGGQDTHIPTDGACELAMDIGSACETWYYGANPWMPGASISDPSYVNTPGPESHAYDPACTALASSWKLITSDPPIADSNWSANWNLIWLDDDDHVWTISHNGILLDRNAWVNVYSFVHHLGWGVDVSAQNWVPKNVLPSVIEMTILP
jgi:hypothetical protein